ncbi:hypothetical protein [Streptomyces sp. NPDC046197]|uniref:hypothetical protein n=1 Tax=Streptomyces sp. NPDC046197 TaxID=3154337 RepID=UPI0033FF9529
MMLRTAGQSADRQESHMGIASPAPNPRANAAWAIGCEECNGWGSVITSQGHHELCLTCQPLADQEDGNGALITWAERTVGWKP